MAELGTMAAPQVTLTLQCEASQIAGEIAELSTKLQKLVKRDSQLCSPLSQLYSNRYDYDNNSIRRNTSVMDTSSIDPYSATGHSANMRISYDPVPDISDDVPKPSLNLDSRRFSQPLSTQSPNAREHLSASPLPSQAVQSTVNFSSKASLMKRSQSTAFGAVPRGNSLAEKDPENIEIKRLRQEERMSWVAIAEHLNKQRIGQGKHPRFTGNAVYSRYTRNAKRIAASNGEVWQSDDDMAQRAKKSIRGGATKEQATTTVTGFDPAEDVLLVEAYDEIVQSLWVLVSQRIAQKGGKIHDPAMCARRYLSL